MRALRDDATALHHRDSVRQADGREAVGDDQRRATLHQRPQGGVDALLDLHVDRRGGVVEDQDGGVDEQCSGDCDALPLPTRERVAALTYDCVVALCQLLDELVSAGGLGGADDVVEAGTGTSVGDVVSDRFGEQEGVVEHHADVVAQARQREVAHIVAVDGHPSAVDVVEAGEQASNGGLARSGGSHDRDRLARSQMEVEVAEHGYARRVREGDVVEVDVALAVDEVHRSRSFRHVRLLVEHLVDAPGRRLGALAHHHEQPQEAERRLQHQHVGVEGDDGAHRDRAVDGEPASVEQHQRLAQAGQVLDDR